MLSYVSLMPLIAMNHEFRVTICQMGNLEINQTNKQIEKWKIRDWMGAAEKSGLSSFLFWL